MLFLVDGYNVTRRDPATGSAPLEAQRDALVARLLVRGRELLGQGRVVVVFDGMGGPGYSERGQSPVDVVFARDRSADDEIVRIAAAADESVVVVSADRGLADRVKAHGGRRVEVRDAACCFESAKGAKRKGSRGTIARDAGLPRGAGEITRELKDLWLNDDSEGDSRE